MTRIWALVVLALLALVACDKPSEDNCRKALLNMQHLLGTDTQNDSTSSADFEGEVRRCRGGSSRAAVECAIKATKLDELERCEFFKIDMTKGSGSGNGSGSGSGSGNGSGSGSGSGSGAGSGSGSGSGSAH